MIEYSKTNMLTTMNSCIFLKNDKVKFEACNDESNYKWLYDNEVN